MKMYQQVYNECVEIVRSLAGEEPLYLDDAISIRLSPHQFPFAAWGLCASPEGSLYVMDADEEWHELTTEDQHAALVIGSIYQRLQMMRTRYAKAS